MRIGSCAALAAALLALPVRGASPTVQLESGSFRIKSSTAAAADRAVVLQFARRTQQALCREIGLPPPPRGAPIEIELACGLTNGPIDHVILRDRQGAWGLIRIPDVAGADPETLRFAIAAVLLRTAVHGYAPAGAAVTEPPVWFVRGLAGHAARERRGADFEAAYALWSRARLPAAQELWQVRSDAAAAHPAVAAQMAAWCAARDQRQRRWEALCRHLAAGGAWNAAEIARIWLDNADAVALDEHWDLWLAERARRIFDAGTTPPGVVRRFRAQLLLYPWEYDMPLCGKSLNGVPLTVWLSWRDRAAIRPGAAASKAAAVRLWGAGRDVSFGAMAGRYAEAWELLDRGADDGELARAWARAEDARRGLEARAAAGETLRTPVTNRVAVVGVSGR
ncbi:MAG: hypothetical protein PHR35_16295 [Kiritimatiellae bacterium]|nr:hypothetical protein [Kiritimatiellia bacterium]